MEIWCQEVRYEASTDDRNKGGISRGGKEVTNVRITGKEEIAQTSLQSSCHKPLLYSCEKSEAVEPSHYNDCLWSQGQTHLVQIPSSFTNLSSPSLSFLASKMGRRIHTSQGCCKDQLRIRWLLYWWWWDKRQANKTLMHSSREAKPELNWGSNCIFRDSVRHKTLVLFFSSKQTCELYLTKYLTLIPFPANPNHKVTQWILYVSGVWSRALNTSFLLLLISE